MFYPECTVPAHVRADANRALAASLLDFGVQRGPRVVRFFADETEREQLYVAKYGVRDWEGFETAPAVATHLDGEALWLRASTIDAKGVSGIIAAAVYAGRSIN